MNESSYFLRYICVFLKEATPVQLANNILKICAQIEDSAMIL
jgi:hypothetical protein